MNTHARDSGINKHRRTPRKKYLIYRACPVSGHNHIRENLPENATEVQ